MTSIISLLQRNGPLISSDLARLLAETNHTSINTASQRITRSSEIGHIRGFFKSQQSLCFLPAHTSNDTLADKVTDAMYKFGRKYWFTLNAIAMHDGIISKRYLECYTNYPIIPLKKHIPFEQVMDKFVKENILVYNVDTYQFSPKFSKAISNPLMHRTIELIKDNILNDFNNLARNTGMVSYNSGKILGEFGKLQWGYRGVCPIAGLTTGTKLGFLLADIMLGKPFYLKDVTFFLEKLKQVQSFKNASRIFPILIVDDVETEALIRLKKHGVMVGVIKELFGQKYAETLKDLIAIFNNAGASLQANPNKYLELIKELKTYNEGLANNIRGFLFEFVVGHIHHSKCKSIDLGREVIGDLGRVDVDVLALYGNKTVMAECKSYKGQVDEELINKWLRESIPAMRKWALNQDRLKNLEIEFEFWSSSGFTEKALEELKLASESTQKYKVSYFGPKEIRAEAVAMKNKKLKEALDNFFIKPMV